MWAANKRQFLALEQREISKFEDKRAKERPSEKAKFHEHYWIGLEWQTNKTQRLAWYASSSQTNPPTDMNVHAIVEKNACHSVFAAAAKNFERKQHKTK